MVRQSLTYLTALCCVLILCAPNRAQTKPAKSASRQSKKPASAGAPTASQEFDPLVAGRQAVAVSLLTALADEARSYRDQTLRARIQARAADGLWVADQERARALFYRAWEAAEIVDQEGAQRTEDARTEFFASRGGLVMIPPVPNVRAEVLRLAAQRDRELGEDLLDKLNKANEQEADAAVKKDNSPKFTDPTEPALVIAKRLALAKQLLESGDLERALRFADPALDRATSPGIIFLVALRQVNAQAADMRYAALLKRSASDPATDATTVSLLSAYVFTPTLLVTVTRNGSLSNQWREQTQAPALAPELRASFFRISAQLLLRPLPPPDQDRTSAGRVGTYFTIARLLPLFEQYAPERAPELRAQLAALASDAPESFRTGEERMLRVGLDQNTSAEDEVEEALEQLERARNAGERDLLCIKAVRAAVHKGDPRAWDFADKIDDAELRHNARAFVTLAAIRKALDKTKAEEAIRLARTGDLPPLQRVWAYTETARLLRKTDLARARELLDDAMAEAQRIDNTTPARANALVAIATRFFDIDHARVWETMNEAIKAANATANFTGEDGQLTARLQTRNQIALMNVDVPAFNLTGLFSALAKDDMERAIELAKSFTGETPRAVATIAIARSILGQKQPRPRRVSASTVLPVKAQPNKSLR